MKTICVPKSTLAQQHLDFDRSQPNELIELIINEEIMYNLFKSGFFYSINKLANSNIDNFEDESITNNEYLHKVLNSDLFDKKTYHNDVYNTINDIKEMFNQALTYGTGVYFYF